MEHTDLIEKQLKGIKADTRIYLFFAIICLIVGICFIFSGKYILTVLLVCSSGIIFNCYRKTLIEYKDLESKAEKSE